MRMRQGASLFALIGMASGVAVFASTYLTQTQAGLSSEDLLRPAPTQPIGSYDYFGTVLSPQQAAELVTSRGLDPSDPVSYQRVGAVQITPQLLASGENIFFNHKIGDTFGLQRVFGFGAGFARILPEVREAIDDLNGQPTSDLHIRLRKDLTVGSRVYLAGSMLDTGLDVAPGASFPVGLNRNGNLTCAVCHIAINPMDGKRLKGVPNGDLNIALLIALSPNTAAGFARLDLDPLDPSFQGSGKTIINSQGEQVTLPDPIKFEQAFDDAVLDVPFGNFESSPDGINNTTQIPNLFTFKSGPYAADGQFAVGPFAGLSAITNAVHSSEINLLAAAQLSAQTGGVDSEVYLGVALQNAADPRIRLPEGAPVKPSEWLRVVAPDPNKAELEDQIPAPGTGSYPELLPSLFTFNGLIFSPDTGKKDPASGPFLFAVNAMAVWQNSLVPPPNRSAQNQQALVSGSVQRGSQVFQQANCASCHVSPFFTDNQIHPIAEIGTNPARAQSRLAINDLLVAPKLFTFNTPVPVPADAEVLDIPTEGISASPTTLPNGLLPDGGYKTTSLRGLYLSAPYLHDGGAAVRAGTLQVAADGITVVDPSGLGLPGTLVLGIPADAASSLRAMVDRDLHSQVTAVNQANPALVRDNLDGTGHAFYVDPAAGFTYTQQNDLINFLLSLDDNPGQF